MRYCYWDSLFWIANNFQLFLPVRLAMLARYGRATHLWDSHSTQLGGTINRNHNKFWPNSGNCWTPRQYFEYKNDFGNPKNQDDVLNFWLIIALLKKLKIPEPIRCGLVSSLTATTTHPLLHAILSFWTHICGRRLIRNAISSIAVSFLKSQTKSGIWMLKSSFLLQIARIIDQISYW